MTADEIQQQMAAIRSRLSDDVAEIRESSETMLDWKFYFKRYPWSMVAAAAAVGYLVVPRRVEVVRPDRDEIAKMIRDGEIVIRQETDAKPRGGLGAILLGLVANALVRAGTAYVGQHAGKIFSGHAHDTNGQPHESTKPL